jgi:peptidoglycan/LPS O-acetylase OafA/YrhL
LITTILLAEFKATGKIRFSNFYIRRGLRLLPALICAVALAGVFWSSNRAWWHAAVAALFYYANFAAVSGAMGSLVPCWSLSVEEHFYLLWPALLLITLARSSRHIVWIPLTLAFASAMFRVTLCSMGTKFYNCSYFYTPTRVDTIFVGATLAVCLSEVPQVSIWLRKLAEVHVPKLLLVIWCGLVFLGGVLRDWALFGGFDLVAGGVAIIIGALAIPQADTSLNRILSSNPLTWLGKRSYGVYLYHLPLLDTLEPFRVRHDLLNFFVVTVIWLLITFLMVELSYRLLELPMLRLKNRFESSNT